MKFGIFPAVIMYVIQINVVYKHFHQFVSNYKKVNPNVTNYGGI